MPFPEILTETLIQALKLAGKNNPVFETASKRLEDLHLYKVSRENDWHQPELCDEKYNALVLECNAWEELCDEMYDYYDTPPKIESKYLELKKHYDK